MDVIVEQGEIADFDAERDGEQFESKLDPLFAMLEALSGDRIETAEKSPSHASVITMKDTDLIGTDDLIPRASGHK